MPRAFYFRFNRYVRPDLVGAVGLPRRLRRPGPLGLKPSGDFLKTAHRAVFSTEIHLIGSSPTAGSQINAAIVPLPDLVGAVGLEPTSLAAADFKSAAYANSATPPHFERTP